MWKNTSGILEGMMLVDARTMGMTGACHVTCCSRCTNRASHSQTLEGYNFLPGIRLRVALSCFGFSRQQLHAAPASLFHFFRSLTATLATFSSLFGWQSTG